jgi:hypothetical protein
MKTQIRRNRLSRFNQPDVICLCCGKRTTRNSGEGTDLCGTCYDSAGYENQHSDTGGDHYGMDSSDCPTCNGVSCQHELKR